MDFTKTTIGNNIGDFLRENLTEDRDKESIRRIMVGNKLAYGEANHLIRSLLYALNTTDSQSPIHLYPFDNGQPHRRLSFGMGPLIDSVPVLTL